MDKPREDVGHVLGPGFPVLPVAAFLDDLGEDRAGRQIQRRKGQFERAGTVTRTVDPVAAEDDPIRRRVVEVDLVDLGIEPVVVRAQRAQDAPDDSEPFVVVKGFVRFNARRNGDRQHDVAVLFALRFPHGAAHGLHDVDLRFSGVHEEHGVQCGHVDALGKAPGVRENAARSPGIALEPFDTALAFERVVLSIDVARLTAERTRLLFCFRQLPDGLPDNVVPMSHQALREFNGVGERDRAGQAGNRSIAGALVLRVLQRAPATDDLRRVADVDLAVARSQMRLQRGVDVLLG